MRRANLLGRDNYLFVSGGDVAAADDDGDDDVCCHGNHQFCLSN